MQLHDKTHCTPFIKGQVMQAHMIDNCSSLCSYSYRVAFKGRLGQYWLQIFGLGV